MSNVREFKRDYPSVVESETAMFIDLGKFLKDSEIVGTLALDMKLCISEAFNNAVIHGNQLNRSKKVSLRLSANLENIVADIIDEGHDGLKHIEGRGKPSDLDEGGRGINLIYQRSENVNLSTVANGGLSIRLTFDRTQKSKNKTLDIGATS